MRVSGQMEDSYVQGIQLQEMFPQVYRNAAKDENTSMDSP